ncbi:hypothetical protein PHMEG_00036501 [Phytophthora megakarya]|uniref:Uncharacterized protein n=1 Tax=Phytophthora megakarya TaxID=4795 RepID=A0A225ULW2_9STRA|nr:hypothetical protein PHMEG_00036501 [Phytophthora megakarya]
MASGFWAVRMTERAKLISAFVCPFGHFQWLRMPFGLKNAPASSTTVCEDSSVYLLKKKRWSTQKFLSSWILSCKKS